MITSPDQDPREIHNTMVYRVAIADLAEGMVQVTPRGRFVTVTSVDRPPAGVLDVSLPGSHRWINGTPVGRRTWVDVTTASAPQFGCQKPPAFIVDAPDTTNPEGVGICGARLVSDDVPYPWTCTRPNRHDGDVHAAGTGEAIGHVWTESESGGSGYSGTRRHVADRP